MRLHQMLQSQQAAQTAGLTKADCREFKDNGGFLCVRGRATTLRGSHATGMPAMNLGYKSPAPHR